MTGLLSPSTDSPPSMTGLGFNRTPQWWPPSTLLRTYDESDARDKASLGIFWLRGESLEDTGNRPAPELIGKARLLAARAGKEASVAGGRQALPATGRRLLAENRLPRHQAAHNGQILHTY